MFRVGDKVGLYEIVAELRAGGMATLFLGRRAGAAGFAKLVAIKVVHEHLAEDPVFVQMFVDEALLSARIQHPNVVHVEELRELNGHHFLVMEFVQGCSLGQLVAALIRRKRRLSPELAIHIAIKIADGLHAAHETRDGSGQLLGVVHRDVSPQNILLSYQGNVKLIDFGIAKARGRVQSTQGGSIKGKFRYMSPEHATGKDLDRRGDVYSLGIVLWEMLTMRRRFDGKSHLDLLAAVRHPDVVPPSRYAPELPVGLDDVVSRAMAKAPDDRYATARDLRDALVDVHPRAAALHESVLGSLLTLVMADQILKDRQQLPSNISGVTLDLPVIATAGPSALETMTVSAEELALLDFADSGSLDSLDPLGMHRAATAILPGSSDAEEEATVFDPSCVGQMQERAAEAPLERAPAPGPTTGPAPPPGPAPQRGQPTLHLETPPRRAHPALLAAGAGALLLIVTTLSFVVVYSAIRPSEEVTSARATAPVSAEPPETAAVPAPLPDAGEPPALDAGLVAVEVEGEIEEPDAGPAEPPPAASGRPGRAGRRSTGRRRSTRRTGRGRPVASEW